MNPLQLQRWFTLSQLDRVGWTTSQKLLDHFKTIDEVFEASEADLLATGASEALCQRLLAAEPVNIDHELEWLAADSSHHIVTPDQSSYPRLLKECAGAPIILYGKGDISLLHQPQIAIVGTRNPTPAGKLAAKDFAAEMARQGLVITSGMALGIDGIAHQAALSSGGATIAVAGTGLDRVYPARHKQLAHQIVEQGLIISEFALGTPVRGINFPKRNRIISGLSLGVLVIEAAIKSGSLITAQMAVEQSREVFALPGSVNNTLAKGCHALIKQGAHLVETADDVLQQIGWLAQAQSDKGESQQNSESAEAFKAAKHPDANGKKEASLAGASPKNAIDSLDEESLDVLRQIDFCYTSLDLLVERCEKSVADLSSKLLTLELDGWITSGAGGYQRQK